MRKRNVNNFFDSALWHLIYILPILITFTIFITKGWTDNFNNDLTFGFVPIFDNVLSYFSFSNGVFFNTLNDLFGSTGLLPLFNSSTVIMYFTYFCSCWLLHIVIDFLVVLPRVLHNLLEKVVK